MLYKDNCLTVRDLLHALSQDGVSPDAPIGHTLNETGWLSKISSIRLVEGVVVLETDMNEGTLNSEELYEEGLDLLA